jgi:hypothetical protein
MKCEKMGKKRGKYGTQNNEAISASLSRLQGPSDQGRGRRSGHTDFRGTFAFAAGAFAAAAFFLGAAALADFALAAAVVPVTA